MRTINVSYKESSSSARVAITAAGVELLRLLASALPVLMDFLTCSTFSLGGRRRFLKLYSNSRFGQKKAITTENTRPTTAARLKNPTIFSSLQALGKNELRGRGGRPPAMKMNTGIAKMAVRKLNRIPTAEITPNS